VGTPTDSGNGSTEIYTISVDSTNLVRITQNEVNDDSPAWSPDSTRLALRVDNVDPSSPGDSNVVVTPVDSPGVTILGPGANPVWSPDGLLIAMTAAEGGTSRIWVQAATGESRRQVSDVSVASSPPAWSPDGQRLLFSSSGLFLVEVATGVITPLTAEPGALPSWSIAGTIAFSTPGSPSPGVFVIDPDGSGLRRISADLDLGEVPIWAPDGRRLLFGSDVARPMVSTVDPVSGRLSEVGIDSGTARSAAWQPVLP
jgi:TolB protein